MAEKQRLIRLARGRNGFFCPDTRFHLIGGIKPQDIYPADIPLSKSVKRGIKGGGLIDVNKVFTEEVFGVKPEGEIEQTPVNPANEKPSGDEDQSPKNEEVVNESENADVSDKETLLDVSELDFATLDKLTLEMIEDATKKQLQAFVQAQEIELVDLDLNSRSNAEDYKVALKKYFKYE